MLIQISVPNTPTLIHTLFCILLVLSKQKQIRSEALFTYFGINVPVMLLYIMK